MRKLRFSQRPISYRLWYAALLLMCVAPLAAAEYLQRWLDIAPCPLCVMQRYGFWVMGLFALFGLLLGRLPRWADFLAAIRTISAIFVHSLKGISRNGAVAKLVIVFATAPF